MTEIDDTLHGIYEAINTGNLDLLDTYVAPDYVEHTDGYQGVEPFKQQISVFRAAFPDLHVDIVDVVRDGERFGSRTVITGTHTGDLMGMPPTGRTVTVEAVDLGRIANGQAKERWGGLNMFSLLTQLGAIPAPG